MGKEIRSRSPSGSGLAIMRQEAIAILDRLSYPSDLTDAGWDSIKELLPLASKIGSPRIVDLREVISAIFYLVDNGIKWRAMPHDYLPWSTVYTRAA